MLIWSIDLFFGNAQTVVVKLFYGNYGTVANQSFYPTFQQICLWQIVEAKPSSNARLLKNAMRFCKRLALRCSSMFNTFRCSEVDSPRIWAKIFDLRQCHYGFWVWWILSDVFAVVAP